MSQLINKMNKINLTDDCICLEEINEKDKKVKITCHEDGNEHIYNYNIVNNIFYPIWCDQYRWDFLNKNIKYNSSDIILATYPKSGTTWLEQILILMKYGIDKYNKLNPSIRNNFDFSNNIGKIHIEGSVEQTKLFYDSHEIKNNISLEKFNKIPFRIIKTHAAYETLLCKDQLFSNNNKIIIVTRNPLDSAVSCYYHYNNIRNYRHKNLYNTSIDRHISFKNWALLWVKGKVAFGDWFAWTEKWYNVYLNQNDDNIHWIFYEDLVKNPIEELIKLNIFLNCKLSLSELETIKTMTNFDNMKQQAKNMVFDELNSDIHFRKGIIGDWKNYFDEELEETYKSRLNKMEIKYNI
jgi:hypothetical protein